MKTGLLAALLVLVSACAPLADPAPRFDVTLEATQIAANLYTPPAPTATREQVTPTSVPAATRTATPEPTVEVTTEPLATEVVTDEPVTTDEPAATSLPTEELEPQPTPTSNNAELRFQNNSFTMLTTIETEGECFLAGDYIPFRMKALNVAQEAFYLYKNGQRLISINNSPLGPQLASSEPNERDNFIELQPNQEFTWEEEDLGFWVLSLSPDIAMQYLTDTGIGLPAGSYWVTFAYTNDQDGLREQPDGSYLIPRAAWRGTAVSFEVRFKVVNDLGEC